MPRALMEQYTDKEHAVAMIWCLQDHFRRIGAVLDTMAVPREIEGVPLTAEQRVRLCIAFIQSEVTLVKWDAVYEDYARHIQGWEIEDVTDPEDIIDLIHTAQP